MIIRKANQSDVPQIVDIHCNAFKDFFLTSLGPDFLQFYYGAFMRHHNSLIICAVENDKVLGFAATTKVCKGFNSEILKNNLFGLGMLALKLLFVNPKALIRLAKNMTKKGEGVEDPEDYAELYSIGVAKDAQGQGIGKKLLTATEEELKKNGVEKVSLTTDFYNNESAVAFYHSMGYSTLYEFVTYPSRKMYRLIKYLK